ncbi:MAG TPA: hypothetical protein VFS20_03380 [Longimicrobium sp.]|nr:hypothetical protein [Longimicrobium sp.]
MDAPTPAPSGTLQFDTAEPTAQTADSRACTACKTPIQSVYHMASGQVICSGCRIRMEGVGQPDEGPAIRFLRAAAFGAGAAIAGSVIYWAILAATDRNFALIAILVGWMVGRAVHVGSRERGGWGYQSLAIALTYLSICTSFTSVIVEGLRQSGETGDAPAALLYLAGFFISIPMPFLIITESPFTVVIIGLGLWQAWASTKRVKLDISGPFYVQRPQPAPVFGAPAGD